jgi:hypothetical protein
MKIKEIFTISEFTQSLGGLSPLLTKDDCRITNKRKTEHSIVLTLKRESDGAGGLSHLKVGAEFQSEATRLLKWAFVSKDIIGLTLNELSDFETNLQIELIKKNSIFS